MPPSILSSILSKATILVVDDEASNVRLLERILERFGCTNIVSTTDSRQALALFLEKEPDLVLLDLQMPHVTGFSLIEQIKALAEPGDYLPILVLTADVTVETKRRALAAGAKDLVTKPLDHSEVVLRIKSLLENRFLHLELQKQNGLLEGQVRERTQQVEDTLAQLRATQEQIVKQERLRALGMMAGGIAHDFNNALAMILGYSELLLPYVQENAPTRETGYLHHVISAAQDATHVVSRLRDFYRPAGGDEIRLNVDLNEIVRQAVSLTSPRWSSKSLADGVQIEVTTRLQETPPVSAHAPELREVLTNMIFNAVDAMPTGGMITIATHAADGWVTLEISDSGVGMTPEERERCLEPFFTTKGEGGTGLGLAVVYGIIERHGGAIDITSVKHVGTTFTIRLPEASSEGEECQRPADRVDRTMRIFVVDDQEIICELVAEHLRNDGHEVVTIANGREALEQLECSIPDLVITDQSMPEMSGTQLAKALSLRAPQLPVILLTGFGEEIQARGARPEGVHLVLCKPVSAAELRQGIFNVLSHHEEPRPVCAEEPFAEVCAGQAAH